MGKNICQNNRNDKMFFQFELT